MLSPKRAAGPEIPQQRCEAASLRFGHIDKATFRRYVTYRQVLLLGGRLPPRRLGVARAWLPRSTRWESAGLCAPHFSAIRSRSHRCEVTAGGTASGGDFAARKRIDDHYLASIRASQRVPPMTREVRMNSGSSPHIERPDIASAARASPRYHMGGYYNEARRRVFTHTMPLAHRERAISDI